jgi:hypothetical protein
MAKEPFHDMTYGIKTHTAAARSAALLKSHLIFSAVGLLAVLGCTPLIQNTPGASLSPAPAPQYAPAILAAEETPLPLPEEPFEPVTTEGAGAFAVDPGAVKAFIPDNGYTRYATLKVQAGGYMPVKMGEMYFDGFPNWDTTVGYKQYGSALTTGGPILLGEFIGHPDYIGATFSAGQSGDNELRSISLCFAKAWDKQGVYLEAEGTYTALGDGFTTGNNEKVGLYSYLFDMPLRTGVIYERRYVNYDQTPNGRWDGLKFVAQFYGVYRTLLTASYAISLTDTEELDDQVTFEANWFPFAQYYFTFKDEHNFTQSGWEYLLTLGIGYIQSNRFAVQFDFNLRDAECAGEITFSGALEMSYRY